MNSSPQKKRFSTAVTTDTYQRLIRNTLQDTERANRFIASITSAVAVNQALQDCDAGSILAGALLGESLNLSPSPQLGQYYLVPFSVKAKDKNGNAIIGDDGKAIKIKQAQFVLGYKGYIQLAIRSGQYKKLNAVEIKQGELIRFDELNEEIEYKAIADYEQRQNTPTAGYYAMFEYINGFKKIMYWSKQKMESYANTNSQAFNLDIYRKIESGEIPERDLWKYSSFWYKGFDDMAKKTMLRQIISKWGIMSIQMQNAFENDNSFISFNNEGKNFVAVDGEIENENENEKEDDDSQDVLETVNLNELS